jgi:hypothetical protein
MPTGLWLDLMIAPNHSQGAVRLEFDVARRLAADRSTFGGVIKLPAEVSRDLTGTPLMLAGTLRMTGEREGLSIPAQSMLMNENTIRIPPVKGGPIGPFADQIAAALDGMHEKKSDDPYKTLADAVRLAKSCAGFASDPPHSGLSTAERVHAELALSIALTIYSYFGRTLK